MVHAYPNIAAEMARNNITIQDVANVLGLHVTGVYAMLNGSRSFPINKAKLVRDALFPNLPLDYLFSQHAIMPDSAEHH